MSSFLRSPILWSAHSPTITPETGTFGATPTTSIRVGRDGKFYVMSGSFTIADAGSGAGKIFMPLGFTASADNNFVATNWNLGTQCRLRLVTGNSNALIYGWDDLTIIATGRRVDFHLFAEAQ